MSIENITYKQMSDTVSSWIKSNCSNISNYASINSCCKPGYSYSVYTNEFRMVENATASITSSLKQINSSVVDSQLSQFLSSIGISNINAIVPENNFYTLINDLVAFCTSKLKFIVSQSNNNTNSAVKYLVYDDSQAVQSNYVVNVQQTPVYNYICKASTATQLTQYLIILIKSTIRTVSCRYSFSITSTPAW